MSYYRESPSYSRRSPPRVERELLEEELSLKNALRTETETRRLLDEISLLQIKLRKSEDLEVKVETLFKQNNILTQENDQLSRELSERRYEVERIKSTSVQIQERDSIKLGSLSEAYNTLALDL